MAGGIGSRFWPWSRQERPKQFLDILGSGKSLIRQTFERFESFIPASNIYIVTNASYKELVLEQLPELSEDQVLLEPIMRNTAPCIAYASYKIHKQDSNANIIVAPSDHLISNDIEFAKNVQMGLNHVENGGILTLGITPSRPDTGYGYIEYDRSIDNDIKPVIQFREKPDAATAQSFLDQGNFVWNSGIFLWSSKTIISAFQDHLPEMANIFESGLSAFNTPQESQFINDNFPKCENVSIDYGVMEKAQDISVMPCDFGWSDLGTWGSLYEKLEKTPSDNAFIGNNHFVSDANGVLIKSSNDKRIVVQGVNDIIVVDSDETIMICHKDDEQKIKQLVAKLKEADKA